MATPWTFEERLAAYRAEGITKIVIMPGAKTHNRDAETGKAFGPVYGLTVHHTAGDWADDRDGAVFCFNGTSALPGPLCQDYVGEDGTLYVIGHGRCNHAGTTTQAVKNSLLAGRAPNMTDRGVGAENVDANDFMYGLEIENRGDGKDPYEPAQYDTAVRWAAAHIRHYAKDGWDQNNAWGHKEITKRKPDPSFDMNRYRADVKARLAQGGEQEVPLTPQEIQAVAKAVWDHGISNRFRPDADGNPRVIPARFFQEWSDSHYDDLMAAIARVAVAGVDLDALADKVADKLAARLQD